jgi:FkbM family methyltransferase
MLNLRWMRTHLARWVPEPLKRPFRARLFGYRGASPEPGTLRRDGGEVEAAFRGVRFRAPGAAYDDLRYHAVDNRDSVEELESVVRIAREVGGVLLDVGAARGVLSTVFCLARPGNRAVALEPSPVQAADARRMAAMNGLEGRLEVREVAAGSRAAQLPGAVDPIGLIDLAPPPGAETFPVSVVTLDDELRRLGEAPTVVKIDVEGHEGDVLRGARALLTRKPVLLLELHLDLLERRGERVAELVEMLRGRGYRFESSAGRPLDPRAVARSPNAVLRIVAR